jgi:hypothetical protein
MVSLRADLHAKGLSPDNRIIRLAALGQWV